MKNFFLIICIIGLISLTACVSSKSRLHSRSLQVESGQPRDLEKLQQIISKLYWLNESGREGNQYVSFRTRNNTFLSCSPQGMLSSNSTNITENELFTPELAQNNRISLKSRHGKYLGLQDSNFRCNIDRADNSTFITFERNPQISGVRLPSNETLAMKFDRGYLGIRNHMITLFPSLSEDAVFMPPRNMTSSSSS
jgi:hypothetical protein